MIDKATPFVDHAPHRTIVVLKIPGADKERLSFEADSVERANALADWLCDLGLTDCGGTICCVSQAEFDALPMHFSR